MLRTRVESDYRVAIPEALRPALRVGEELFVTTDDAGRLILIHDAHIRSVLQRTAGMWRGRTDIPADGTEYVNRLRQGRRLNELGVVSDGD